MFILHVSDLHLDHDWFDWVAGHAGGFDLIVIAGDLLDCSSRIERRRQAREVASWVRRLAAPAIVCSGNHDDLRHLGIDWVRRMSERGDVFGADGDVVDFVARRTGERARIVVNGWLDVPVSVDGTQILITHAPPAGCACAISRGGRDAGDPELWPALRYSMPGLILAGHVHAPAALHAKWPGSDGSTVLVPGVCDHESVPAHWIIDTSASAARHSSGLTAGFRWPGGAENSVDTHTAI